jgi:hypothetical protein
MTFELPEELMRVVIGYSLISVGGLYVLGVEGVVR